MPRISGRQKEERSLRQQARHPSSRMRSAGLWGNRVTLFFRSIPGRRQSPLPLHTGRVPGAPRLHCSRSQGADSASISAEGNVESPKSSLRGISSPNVSQMRAIFSPDAGNIGIGGTNIGGKAFPGWLVYQPKPCTAGDGEVDDRIMVHRLDYPADRSSPK